MEPDSGHEVFVWRKPPARDDAECCSRFQGVFAFIAAFVRHELLPIGDGQIASCA